MRADDKSDIIDTTEKKQLCWHNHVQQMTHERLPKIIMNGVPMGKKNEQAEVGMSGIWTLDDSITVKHIMHIDKLFSLLQLMIVESVKRNAASDADGSD
jgi:hypothetical protein